MNKKVQSILDKVQGLYKKDESMKRIINHSVAGPKVFTEDDGVPLPLSNPIRCMTGLPCLPFNRVGQIHGKPDTGKSTTAAEIMASAQKAGFYVILLDSEDKADLTRYDAEFGGKSNELFLIKTNEIRKGGQLIKDFVNAIKSEDQKAKILIVWDSVGGSISRGATERNLADEKHAQPGASAKENGEVIRHLVAMFNKYPDSISVLLVNQTYAKIGFMMKGDQASGGTAVEYFSSLIVNLRRVKTLTKTENKKKVKYGIITRATVSKNHLSQGKTSTYQMDFVITAGGSQVSDMDIIEDEEAEE